MGLALSHALALFREFLERERIHDGHVFQGRIGEYDPRLQMQAAGHIFPEVLEHGEQDGVSPAAAAGGRRQILFLIILSLGECAVFHQQHLMGVLQEFQARRRGEDESVVLNVLVQIMQDEPLMDDSGPETDVVVFSGAEQRELVVFVGLDHGRSDPGKDGGQMLQFEAFRQGLDELDDKA